MIPEYSLSHIALGITILVTYIVPACLLLDTCATGTAGTFGACTCPSHTGHHFCRYTGHPWWHCGGKSLCIPRSSEHCSGSPRPCLHRHCTPHFQASWGQDPSSFSGEDFLQREKIFFEKGRLRKLHIKHGENPPYKSNNLETLRDDIPQNRDEGFPNFLSISQLPTP